jgi:ribosomal protein L7/L12
MSDPQAPLSDAIVAALKNGGEIEAIKQLRAERGLGLKEAKDVIESYMSGQRLSAVTNGAPLSDIVITALKNGQKIEAIKQIRGERGLGLKAAKDVAEDYIKANPELAQMYAQRQAPGSVIILLFIVIIALAVFGLMKH